PGIKLQHFDSLGNKVGIEALVNSTTANGQDRPAIAVLADGSYVIAWDDGSQAAPDTLGHAIRARHFAQDGTTLGNDFVVNTTTLSEQSAPSIAPLFGGGFIVTWHDGSMTA